MPSVVARIKIRGKHYEISVDFDEVLEVKNGTGDITKALNSNSVFYNAKEGDVASQKDLMEAFGTIDLHAIAKTIITRGEVEKPREYREAEREARIKKVIALLMRNAVDQHGRPYTEERLRRAIGEVRWNFDNRPAEKQMPELLEKLKTIIPIRVETKKIKLIIPARYSGIVYAFLKDYKESEDWAANGDLHVIMNIPAGMQLDFYDKLNSVTHGAVVSEELKE